MGTDEEMISVLFYLVILNEGQTFPVNWGTQYTQLSKEQLASGTDIAPSLNHPACGRLIMGSRVWRGTQEQSGPSIFSDMRFCNTAGPKAVMCASIFLESS